MKEVTIDGVTYVPKDSVNLKPAKSFKGMTYAIVRTYSAGVFAGYIKGTVKKEMRVFNARRIWYWSGAASLSQLSQDGTNAPDKCKFPMEVPHVDLTEVIEVLPCTEKARKSIEGVPIWKM